MAARVKSQGDSYRIEGDGSASLADINDFLEALDARGLSPATIRTYAFDLVMLDRWFEKSGQQIDELTQASLLEFIAFQKQLGAQPSSINRRLTTCELFCRFVTGEELVAGSRVTSTAPHYKGRGRDHALGLHRLHKRRRLRLRVKAPHKLVDPLTAEQVTVFIRSLRRYRDLAIVYLMLFCGLRSGELLSLRLSDINDQERRLRVRGKGNRERALPLPNVLIAVISDYLRLERPARALTGHLFVVLQGRRRGHPMTPAGLRNLFRHRRQSNKKIRNANAHRFRHTFGTDMARAGVRLPILQRMMGHADGKTTLQYINLSLADVAAEYTRAIAVIEKRYGGES